MSEDNQDEIKKQEKFQVLSKMFGTPSSKYDLLANLFQQPRRKKVRHQETIGKKRIDTRPSKASFKIVGKKVPEIESITEMIVQDDFIPKKIDTDLRRVKEGDFIQSRGCKLGRKKKTRIT